MPSESSQEPLASNAPDSASKSLSGEMATVSGAVLSTDDPCECGRCRSDGVTTADGGLVTHPGDTATADTDAIRARAEQAAAWRGHWAKEWRLPSDEPLAGDALWAMRAAKQVVVDDVPALLDEVARLRAEVDEFRDLHEAANNLLANAERELATATTERDQARASLAEAESALNLYAGGGAEWQS